jgi:hypothetical protein
MNKIFFVITLVLLAFLALAGCTSVATGVETGDGGVDAEALIARYKVELTPATGTVVGRLTSSVGMQVNNTPVYLAPVFWDAERKQGAFALDGSTSPSTISKEDGVFIISGIQPGEYAIIVGEIIGTSVVIQDEKGDALVINVEADKTINLEVLDVKAPN